jgi:hypothetical protein
MIDIDDDGAGLIPVARGPVCGALEESRRNVPSAASQIRQDLSWLRVQPIEKDILPYPVQTPGHEIIHQVIIRGHGAKHSPHQPHLFIWRNVAVPKTDLLHDLLAFFGGCQCVCGPSPRWGQSRQKAFRI